MKKQLSFILALAMIASLILVAAPAAMAALSTEYTAERTLANIKNFDDSKAHFGIVDDPAAETYKKVSDAPGGLSTITIDFVEETIYWTGAAPTKAPAMVSFDAGGKWTALKFSIGTAAEPGDFSKFLNKEATVWLTDAWDAKNKEPQKAVAAAEGVEAVAAANIWKFTKNDARPKFDKFSIDYATYAGTGENFGGNGQWTLKKAGTLEITALQIGYSTDKGKNVLGWGKFPAAEGLNVVAGATKPGEKLSFVARVAPTANSAGSKGKKFGVSTLTKAPALKLDYKKNLLKLKAGTVIFDATPVMDGEEVIGFEQGAEVTGLKAGTADFTMTKPADKADVSVKPGLTFAPGAEAKHYSVRVAPTEKKPASEMQLITVAPASAVYEVDAAVTRSKMSFKLPKAYEAALWADREKPETKWKSSIKVTGAGVYAVRLKNTAKYNAKTNETIGNTTSDNLILDIAVGKVTQGKKEVDAVTAAVYLGQSKDASPVGTGSAAEAAVYISAAEMARTVKVDASNKTTNEAAVTVTPIIKETVEGSVTYSVTGLLTVFGEADVTGGTTTPITLVGATADVIADGDITVTFASTVEKFYTPGNVVVKIDGFKEPEGGDEPGDLDPTADITLALTTPSDAGNTFLGEDKAWTAAVETGTDTVVITATKTEEQTIVIGGDGVGLVTAGGSATEPTYTIDTEDVKTGGTVIFTLTVSEADKADIVYTITVAVAAEE
ncbi:MAG: hypothetical protein FWG93_01675 [Oscillospiraceae bacterium]|nr:hypothetical protein [Oscillospiraceae bacterium]